MADNNPIGVFDSGLGGLTVLAQIKQEMPSENLVYFGDTARVPYGTKSPDTVIRYSMEIASFLVSLGVKIIVVACNTASSSAVDELREKLAVPVIGVIRPGAETAVKTTVNGKIGIIGTAATIASGTYERTIREIMPEARIFSGACPLFVPLAEEGWHDNEVAEKTAQIYLSPIRNMGIDTLILGCTHYPVLKGIISKVVGPEVKLVDSAVCASLMVREVLTEAGLLSDGCRMPEYRYFVSDESQRFKSVGELFLKERLPNVVRIVL